MQLKADNLVVVLRVKAFDHILRFAQKKKQNEKDQKYEMKSINNVCLSTAKTILIQAEEMQIKTLVSQISADVSSPVKRVCKKEI